MRYPAGPSRMSSLSMGNMGRAVRREGRKDFRRVSGRVMMNPSAGATWQLTSWMTMMMTWMVMLFREHPNNAGPPILSA